VIVTGCKGQLGQALLSLAGSTDIELLGVSHSELDITDRFQIEAFFKKIKPDLLINTAAFTAVDKAERDTRSAYRANCDGPRYLAEACNQAGIPIIHLSTDYVFDGELDRSYCESDVPHPLNVYGESKSAGERAVQQAAERHIILRTSWLFSEQPPNFVRTMLTLATGKAEQLKIVNDQVGGPTSAASVAKLLLLMATRYFERGALNWGIYHFAGQPYCSWYEFAETIFTLAQEKGLVESRPDTTPIQTHEYPSLAKRPQNSMLDSSKVSRDFGVYPCDWRAELEKVLQKVT
jgi:dTDP-4-dehydrorhamnose reductase